MLLRALFLVAIASALFGCASMSPDRPPPSHREGFVGHLAHEAASDAGADAN